MSTIFNPVVRGVTPAASPRQVGGDRCFAATTAGLIPGAGDDALPAARGAGVRAPWGSA